MYAVIVASAPELDIGPYQKHIRAADLLIAADGGALPLLRAGIMPHGAIGGMDSIDAAGLAGREARGGALRRVASAEDEPDRGPAPLYAAATRASASGLLAAV